MKTSEMKSLMKEAVAEVLQEGRIKASSFSAYKETERRLNAIPTLISKVENDKEMLAEIHAHGPRERSKSIVRFQRSGMRVSPEEMLEAIIKDLESTIAKCEYEIETMNRALSIIGDDPYSLTVRGKYIEGMTDDAIARQIPCDNTTVWRNRKRLVQKLAVWLYGTEAI